MPESSGRRLRWHEFGDPDGSPVIYTAGTPVSGLGGGCYDTSARAATLHISDSSGHDVGYYRSDEITSVLSSYLS